MTFIFHSFPHSSNMPSLSAGGAQPCHSPEGQLRPRQIKEAEVAQGALNSALSPQSGQTSGRGGS